MQRQIGYARAAHVWGLRGAVITSKKWTAIILAGQRPGADPLASAFGGAIKALVDIDGEPVITQVVRTHRKAAARAG